MAILQTGIAVLFAIIGSIWLRGKGFGMFNMPEKMRNKIDQKPFLRFNALNILVASVINALSAIFIFAGFSWGYLPGVLSIFILAALAIYSILTKSFRLKGEDGEPLADDPAKRKKTLILIGVFVAVTMLPIVWLFFEGTRPIRADFAPSSVSFSGLYGISVPFDEITEVYLYDKSMIDIGAGIRRMGHGTPNNLRGRFDAGHLLVQNPDEGPTIRISRRTAGPLYISLRTPQATEVLYRDMAASIR